jgi:O-acetyl-ADP-ribose deacetylase (regulator of RNase III)
VWDEHAPADADRLLASCYVSSLQLASAHGLSSIAFPCISTGFPADRAAAVAVAAVRQEIDAGSVVARVVFCCFSDQDLRRYRKVLDA